MHLRGVNATTVEDVLEAAGAGKGQFYHHFESRAELEAAVLDFQVARQPETGSDPPTSWDQVDAWFDALYALYAMNDFEGGCPLGSMASEVADRDAELRRRLDEAFQAKADYLARGLEALRARGELERTADPRGPRRVRRGRRTGRAAARPDASERSAPSQRPGPCPGPPPDVPHRGCTRHDNRIIGGEA